MNNFFLDIIALPFVVTTPLQGTVTRKKAFVALLIPPHEKKKIQLPVFD